MHVDVSILCRVVCDGSNLLVETLWEALHQGGTSSQHNIVVQANFEVRVALINRIYGDLSNSCSWFVSGCAAVRVFENAGVENDLGRLKTLLVSDLDNLTARKLIAPLLNIQDVVSRVVVCVVVHGDVTHLFFHLTHVLEVLASELDTSCLQLADEGGRDVLAGDLQRVHSVRKRISFENGHRVGHAFSTFRHQSASFSR